MTVTTGQLRAVVAVVDDGGFSAAAKGLGISQSAVSHAVAASVPRNVWIASPTSFGRSSCGKSPHPGRTSSRAPGMSSAKRCPVDTGTSGSFSPKMSRVGTSSPRMGSVSASNESPKLRRTSNPARAIVCPRAWTWAK